jgi:hypothetical protein
MDATANFGSEVLPVWACANATIPSAVLIAFQIMT